MSTFQTIFKTLRINAGFTQQELAKRMKVSQSTITMWENGKRQPDIETLEEIADLFNVDMNYLTGVSRKTTKILNQSQHDLLMLYDQLNEEGQQIVLHTAEGLVASKQYIKTHSEDSVVETA